MTLLALLAIGLTVRSSVEAIPSGEYDAIDVLQKVIVRDTDVDQFVCRSPLLHSGTFSAA